MMVQLKILGPLFLILTFFNLSLIWAQDVEPPCTLAQIFATSPREIIIQKKTFSDKAVARFSWSPVPGAASYQIDISPNTSFEPKKTFFRNQERLHIRANVNQIYYWRVTAFDEKNAVLSCPQATPFDLDLQYIVLIKPTGTRKKSLENKPNSQEVEQSFAQLPSSRNTFHHLWVATSIGYLNLEQNHEIIGKVTAKGIVFPNAAVHYTSEDFGRLALDIHAEQLVGEFEGISSGVTLLDNKFQWLNFFVGGYYRLSDPESSKPQWSLHAGYRFMKTPYFTALSPTVMSAKNLNIHNLVLGGRWDKFHRKGRHYHVALDYAYPIKESGSGLNSAKSTSSLILDLQLGFRKYNSRGIFWGANYNLNYRDIDEEFTSDIFTSPGNRTFFFNMLELQAGLIF